MERSTVGANIPGPTDSVSRFASDSTWDTYTQIGENARDQAARLYALCDEGSWIAIREWLHTHRQNVGILVVGAETLGDYDTTPLHLACRNAPPVDVVQKLLEIAPDTIMMTDTFKWLPMHYACANGASLDVLRILTERYPQALLEPDTRGRRPIHFALGNKERPALVEVVEFLVSNGAASCEDENKMIPIHYACLYGADVSSIRVLTNLYPPGVTATDNRGFTPLHFAMSNCSPLIVDHLLSQRREVANRTNKEGQLPLHLLSTQASRSREDDNKFKAANAQLCLDLYLKAGPLPTANFFTALEDLPMFLRERAVVSPLVQEILNKKISQRFQTMILMLDFMAITLIIVVFRLAIFRWINMEGKKNLDTWYSFCLFLGGTYFLMRETVQLIALASLGVLKTWFTDMKNLLDMGNIAMVFFWAVYMTAGTNILSDDQFRTGTALSTGILWCVVLAFLRSTIIGFAVFVGGVFYVLRRLVAFLVALGVILVAFAQMFFTVYQNTDFCNSEEETEGRFPFCVNIWQSLLKVYIMLLGEIDEQEFIENSTAIWLLVVFIFMVVILLANVLIAIVTDSYGVIKNERSQIVFWTNRLDFVAEIDHIATIFCFSRDAEQTQTESDNVMRSRDTFGEEAWKKIIDLYEDMDLDVFSVEFLVYLTSRATAALVIIPGWLLIGLLTAGTLWPPQVREYLFVQKSSNSHDLNTQGEQRKMEVNELKTEISELQKKIVALIAAVNTSNG